MKQRFSSLDVKVIAHELQSSLVSLRLSNIYDLSSKIFLLKFASKTTKHQLIIDSGFRCHLTAFGRDAAPAPSIFVQKLRKYLKTRRVTSVRQVGTDRILEFQFSDGTYRLFLEFFAAGNVILTDKELNILTLLRIVPPGEGQEEQKVGLQYSLDNRQNYSGIPELTKERVRDALQKAADNEKPVAQGTGKQQKKAKKDVLRKVLATSITEYPPLLVDHAMRVTGFDTSLKPGEVAESDDLLDSLLKALEEAGKVIQRITSADITKGYIVAKKSNPEIRQALDDGEQEVESERTRQNLLYEDFHPFKPKQFEDDPDCIFVELEGFNKTVDEFFSSIEGQRLESRLQERELQAKKKLDAAKRDQEKRIGGLKEIQTLNERKAAAIEVNAERVQEAMDAVNGLIAQGMDWVEIGKLIELEQKRKNPVASIIKLPLKLEENTITLLLDEEEEVESDNEADETDSEASDSEDDEAPSKQPSKKIEDKRLSIDINLGVSPWSNAREYYEQRKSALEKEEKTLKSSTKALKSTAQKIEQDLKKGLKQEKALLRPVRQPKWFEKFNWFVSSDGYLVLGGRDAQQNEILYKKYLRKGDVYVHADLHGAGTIVIKNNQASPDAPIPPSTLSQAGTLAVCSSSAWDSKAVMAAWWVNADQVSKSAPTGEFLPMGSFMVRGKKNFLPPARLELGFGLMWHISDDSKANHTKHRIQTPPQSSAVNTPAESVFSRDDKDDESANGSDSEDEPASPPEDNDEQERLQNPLQSSAGNASDNEDVPVAHSIEDLADKVNDVSLNTAEAAHDSPAHEDNDKDRDSDEEGHSSAQPSGTATPSSKPTKGPAPLPRGKRTKAKKAAKKYAWQDEEDRAAAQALIGAAVGKEKALKEAEEKAKREAETLFQKERRRMQHLRTQEEVKRTEEARKRMLEDDVLDEELEGEAETAAGLDAVVGAALPGDEIIECIPVCAPWAAMGRYKYKVKIQPGTGKKGKVVKEILGAWTAATNAKGVIDEKALDKEKMWPREVELIRSLRSEEWVGAVPVKGLRVVQSGGLLGGKAGKDGKGKDKPKKSQRGQKKK